MTPLSVGTSSLACLLLIALCRVVRLGRRNKSVLQESLIGEIGDAQIPLEPHGFVTVRCRTYPACSTSPIAAGDRVSVVGIEKILTVKPYSL